MSEGKRELINFWLRKSEESFDMCAYAIQKEYWGSAASELYYTCFYLVQALFAQQGLESNTHAGLKALFSQMFIREGKIEERWGKLLSRLFTYRQQSDYGSARELDKENIGPLVAEVAEFRALVHRLLQQP